MGEALHLNDERAAVKKAINLFQTRRQCWDSPMSKVIRHAFRTAKE